MGVMAIPGRGRGKLCTVSLWESKSLCLHFPCWHNTDVIFFFFLGLQLWHMEFPQPVVESELQLPAYTTAPATQDLSHICNLHHSPWHHQILNASSKARDRTGNLMVPSWIHFRCTTVGTPDVMFSCDAVLTGLVPSLPCLPSLFGDITDSHNFKYHLYDPTFISSV